MWAFAIVWIGSAGIMTFMEIMSAIYIRCVPNEEMEFLENHYEVTRKPVISIEAVLAPAA